jgi:hypothetical protein
MGNTWRDWVLFLGVFLMLFGAYLLFLKGPAANQAQHYFRVGVMAAGGIVTAVGATLKASSSKPDE